jgi:hypothetical protein
MKEPQNWQKSAYVMWLGTPRTQTRGFLPIGRFEEEEEEDDETALSEIRCMTPRVSPILGFPEEK